MSTAIVDRPAGPAPATQPTGARASGGPVRRHRIHWAPALRWTVLLASLATVTRMGLSGSEEIRSAASVLAGRNLPVVGLVLLVEVAWAWSLAQISRTALMAVGGRVTRLQALRISMAGFTLSRVVPTGGVAGGVFAARELTLLGNAAPVALAGMVVSWAVSMLALATMVLGAVGFAAAAGHLPLPSLLPAALALLVLLAAAAVGGRALRSPPLRRRVGAAVGRGLRRVHVPAMAGSWEEPLEAVSAHLCQPRRLLPVLAWSVVAWTLDVTALWLLFAAFGHELPVGQIALGYGFANLLSALPELTPGWLGVYEAAVAATYAGMGAPPGVALAAVMAYRLASFWLPVAAGVVPVIRSLGRSRSRGEAAAAGANGKEATA